MKRIILALVVFVLFVALAGCGQSAQVHSTNLNSHWDSYSGKGATVSLQGDTLVYTFDNCTLLSGSLSTQRVAVTPGTSYTFSVQVKGSNPRNIGAGISLGWIDAHGHDVGALLTDLGTIPAPTTTTTYKISGIAPKGAMTAVLSLWYQRSSTTNSGTITWTQAQFVTD